MASSVSCGAPSGVTVSVRNGTLGASGPGRRPPPPRMLRLAVRVTRSQAELVLAELLSLAPSGVEEVDLGDDVVEYAVYGARGELPSLPDLRAAAGGALVEVSTSEIADDWSERWRAFHRPLVLEGQLRVRPPWEPAGSEPIDLVIEPGQAFGTGAHATTRLCLELLLSGAVAVDGGFLDLGCGSGVLAIAAARLGFAPVVALDYDPAAVEATAANAAVNGVAVEVARYDLRGEDDPQVAATVAANLLGPLLRRWAPRIAHGARQVIASGLLTTERDSVASAFADVGMSVVAERVGGEWAALLLTRG
jgi:ribosomal protein L11 methyltransferase